MHNTHTYVVLEVSSDAYQEIKLKLKAAGYDHAFMSNGEIDMHGIAVSEDPTTTALFLGAAARQVERAAAHGMVTHHKDCAIWDTFDCNCRTTKPR